MRCVGVLLLRSPAAVCAQVLAGVSGCETHATDLLLLLVYVCKCAQTGLSMVLLLHFVCPFHPLRVLWRRLVRVGRESTLLPAAAARERHCKMFRICWLFSVTCPIRNTIHKKTQFKHKKMHQASLLTTNLSLSLVHPPGSTTAAGAPVFCSEPSAAHQTLL